MALEFGFYNSLNGDRRYNAVQMSDIFEGLITDGIYPGVGEMFAVTPGEGLQILVGTGRAWFESTWTRNRAKYPLDLDIPDPIFDRIDTVCLKIDKRQAVRANSLEVLKGIVSTTPTAPTIPVTDPDVFYHPLAHIRIRPVVSSISASDITLLIGTSECPYVTSILQQTNIDVLFANWTDQFTIWWDNLKKILDGDAVGNILNELEKKVNISDKATSEEAVEGTNDTHWMTPALVNQARYIPGDVRINIDDISKGGNSTEYIRADGRVYKASLFPSLADTSLVQSSTIESRITNIITWDGWGCSPDDIVVGSPDSQYVFYSRSNSNKLYRQIADMSMPPIDLNLEHDYYVCSVLPLDNGECIIVGFTIDSSLAYFIHIDADGKSKIAGQGFDRSLITESKLFLSNNQPCLFAVHSSTSTTSSSNNAVSCILSSYTVTQIRDNPSALLTAAPGITKFNPYAYRIVSSLGTIYYSDKKVNGSGISYNVFGCTACFVVLVKSSTASTKYVVQVYGILNGVFKLVCSISDALATSLSVGHFASLVPPYKLVTYNGINYIVFMYTVNETAQFGRCLVIDATNGVYNDMIMTAPISGVLTSSYFSPIVMSVSSNRYVYVFGRIFTMQSFQQYSIGLQFRLDLSSGIYATMSYIGSEASYTYFDGGYNLYNSFGGYALAYALEQEYVPTGYQRTILCLCVPKVASSTSVGGGTNIANTISFPGIPFIALQSTSGAWQVRRLSPLSTLDTTSYYVSSHNLRLGLTYKNSSTYTGGIVKGTDVPTNSELGYIAISGTPYKMVRFPKIEHGYIRV